MYISHTHIYDRSLSWLGAIKKWRCRNSFRGPNISSFFEMMGSWKCFPLVNKMPTPAHNCISRNVVEKTHCVLIFIWVHPGFYWGSCYFIFCFFYMVFYGSLFLLLFFCIFAHCIVCPLRNITSDYPFTSHTNIWFGTQNELLWLNNNTQHHITVDWLIDWCLTSSEQFNVYYYNKQGKKTLFFEVHKKSLKILKG